MTVSNPNLPAPTLTLSLDNVDFGFHPTTAESAVDFRQGPNEVLLNLTSFTGTLRVSLQQATVIEPSSARKVQEYLVDLDQHELNDATPKTKHLSESKSRDDGAVVTTAVVSRKHNDATTAQDSEDDAAPPSKKARQSAVEDELVNFTASQTTILDQPDFSQTQMSSMDQEDEKSHQLFSADAAAATNTSSKTMTEPPSRVETILMEAASFTQDKDDDAEQSVVQDEEENTAVVLAPARVSLGGSPAVQRTSSGQTSPCARWGHAMTCIGEDRVLVYGGQSFDQESGAPVTLKDIFIYDLTQQTWFKPFNCEGMPRQWHTATFLPERQLLISFGGESANPKTGKIKTTDQVMVLDTEIMLWYPPTVSGDVPSGRSGHTATMLPKTNELVVFGGVKGSKWLNTVSVLDTVRWSWRTPKIQGSAPKPRSYHSATALGDNRVVVFGGNDAGNSFGTVHVLETAGEKWQWTHPFVTGYAPCNRTGHSATLLADKKTICIYGGWDPNAEDEQISSDDANMIFSNSYLLDTDKWVWKKGPVTCHAELPMGAAEPDGGAKRVGHTSVLNKGSEILVFGGRVPQDRFTGDFQSMIVSASR